MHPVRDLHENVAHLTDDEFIDRVFRSLRNRDVAGLRYPAFPRRALQEMFVGSAGADALAEAAGFYRAVKASLARLEVTLRSDSVVIDFGVGWGRIIRFFAHDVAPASLIGVDVNETILEEARACEIPAEFRVVRPMPPFDLAAESATLVYAYSVFSHLNAAAIGAWVAEFARVLRPGGVAIVTTRSRGFIAECAALRELRLDPASYAGRLAEAFDERDAGRRYDAGEIVHVHLGADLDNYGETLVPIAHAATAWAPLRVVEYVDQLRYGRNVAYIVLRKPL